MIIARLMGGLGNQMFQYAAARTLALRLGVELKLDLSFFNQENRETTPRSYELDVFRIAAAPATLEELSVAESLSVRNDSIFSRLKGVLSGQREEPFLYREPHFQYDPELLKQPDGTVLSGYWQSERYFVEHRPLLLSEFTLKNGMESRYQEIEADIDSSESVAVHIRRGDYASNPAVADYHGLCSLDYYHKAAAIMARQLKAPRFFLFSDDPDWVAGSLKLSSPSTVASFKDCTSPASELLLFSRCSHAIIANSSFSWWGGWLNQNRNKIVIAPERWFARPEINTDDLIPASWIRL